MKSDPLIYLYLSIGPEAFRILSGGERLKGEYRFTSLTLKGIERRIDGLFEPVDGATQPVHIIEFQAQRNDAIGYNLYTKMGLYGEEQPHRDVRGILVLLSKSHRPKCPRLSEGEHAPIRVVYLREVMQQWLEKEPDNPFVIAFAPLIQSKKQLSQSAAGQWKALHAAPLDEGVRDRLQECYQYLIFERFKQLNEEEIKQMLTELVPIEETRAYQSIFAKGEARGVVKGEAIGEITSKRQTLKRQLKRRFGELPDWGIERIDGADVSQLDAWLDGIFDAESVAGLLER